MAVEKRRKMSVEGDEASIAAGNEEEASVRRDAEIAGTARIAERAWRMSVEVRGVFAAHRTPSSRSRTHSSRREENSLGQMSSRYSFPALLDWILSRTHRLSSPYSTQKRRVVVAGEKLRKKDGEG
jgi:hypothetical protein